MAWLEGMYWRIEQGIDALLELHLVSDEATDTPWDFTGWSVVGVVADDSDTESYDCTIESTPDEGIVRFILLEEDVNALSPTKRYFFNGLLISPSPDLADDHHVAYMQIALERRPARRPTP